MIRLGFAVRSVARPGLGGPRTPAHLSQALAGLGDMLAYLARIDVRFYRVALELPLLGEQTQLDECAAQIEAVAEQLAATKVRLGVHLPLGFSLAVPDPAAAALALANVEAMAALLAALDAARGANPIESTMVAHLGAPVADTEGAARFAARYMSLSAHARVRFALEHEGHGPSLGQLLHLHQRCGVPVVFDALHWELHNPEELPLGLALGLALATWPAHVRPEVHLSSHRSEAHLMPGREGAPTRVLPPRPGQHADFVATSDLERLLRAARGLPPFDIMLEAKAGDLALLRLRAELAQRAPRLAALLN